MREEVIQYLLAEAPYDEETLRNMSNAELEELVIRYSDPNDLF